MRNKKLLCLVECAVMIALAFGLSFVKLWQMPLGGSVTLCSMLPILLIGLRHGPLVGLGTGFVYSLTQLAQGFMEGDIAYAAGDEVVFIVAMLFDYILPYTLIGLSGILGKKNRWMPIAGMSVAVALRFVCHYLTGVTIWSQWTPDGWASWIYSAAYNGGYLIPDLAITLAVAVFMLSSPAMRRLLGIKEEA
ncbi:MAG: energy-coupled thiamine transporter ThiT [Clostridia bacterium]|nr:energy-coupled thiamine transporter ThiT [Clostridia bacterium]